MMKIFDVIVVGPTTTVKSDATSKKKISLTEATTVRDLASLAVEHYAAARKHLTEWAAFESYRI
ncbi:MAG: hypothetical protein ACE5NJ_10150 [Thermodesulfobacteriota bacterium]